MGDRSLLVAAQRGLHGEAVGRGALEGLEGPITVVVLLDLIQLAVSEPLGRLAES